LRATLSALCIRCIALPAAIDLFGSRAALLSDKLRLYVRNQH
jgi:hypothetical protein